jgi:pilus assembly protein Flp/PilA
MLASAAQTSISGTLPHRPAVAARGERADDLDFHSSTSSEILAVKILTMVRNFFARTITHREEGATLAEYGLLLALIAVVCIVAITAFGSTISNMFSSIAGTI